MKEKNFYLYQKMVINGLKIPIGWYCRRKVSVATFALSYGDNYTNE